MRCWFLLQTTWHRRPIPTSFCSVLQHCQCCHHSKWKLRALSTGQSQIRGQQRTPRLKFAFFQLLKVLLQQNPRGASWAGHPLALFISFRNNFSEIRFPFYSGVPGKSWICCFTFFTCPCKHILAADYSGCSGSLWKDYNDSRRGWWKLWQFPLPPADLEQQTLMLKCTNGSACNFNMIIIQEKERPSV